MTALVFFICSLAFPSTNPAPPTVQDAGPTPPLPTLDRKAAWAEFESTVRFRYAYLDRAPGSVNELFDRAGQQAASASSPDAFRRVLQAVGYAFRDPHFVVGPLSPSDANVIPTSSDMVVTWRDSHAVVQDVRQGSAADVAGVRPGWVIVSIDGQDIRDRALELLCGVVSEPSRPVLEYAATVAINGRRDGTRELVFRPDGDEVTLELPSPRVHAKTLIQGPLWSFQQVGEIGVIRIQNSLGNNELIHGFDDAIRAAHETKGIVLDLRNTPSGGNTEVARSVIGHFIDQVKSYQVHQIPSFEREFGVPRSFVEQVHPREPRYDKPFVVLAGQWTGSMGEGIVIGLDAAANAITVASDMGDLLGGIHGFDLPLAGLRLELGDEALFHVNGEPREDFVADVELAAADRDPNGEDPGLKAALNQLENLSR